MKIPHYDANPAHLDDFILDFDEMRFGTDARDKWACRTFQHRLALELKAHLLDTIWGQRIRREEQSLDWLEQEERVDTPKQNLDDLWARHLNLERGELRLREGRRYLGKYCRLLNKVKDLSESGEICHLLWDVLPAYWKKRLEDEEKKRAKKRMAVRIVLPEEQHPGIMEYFRRKLRAPERIISLKNSLYVEVFRETACGHLLQLNNFEWRREEKLKLEMIPAEMSLDLIIQYVTIQLKLNCKNEAHIQDRPNHGNHDRREDGHHPEVEDDRGGSSEDARGEGMTGEDPEEAQFFAFAAHNTKEHG